MPGSWSQVATICASRQLIAYQQCNRWADEGSAACSSWKDEGSNQCARWKDEGTNQCARWADEGSRHCCDWWPCSWLCQAWYWVAKWVCVAWYWVANWVCQAWYWVANWVCQAWYWVARWVCKAWVWVFYLFCSSADGGPAFLLTDGTVLMNECSNGFGTRRWWKLTPDATGSYANGLWTRTADSATGRKYFSSAVLADGRLLVCGGEYSDSTGSNSQDDTAASEIYDPVADSWAPLAPPPGVTQIGDSPCTLLSDGRFLMGNFNASTTFVFDPASGQWSAAGTGGAKGDSGSEETWVLMPDGTVISPQCAAAPNSELYDPSTDTWQPAGSIAPTLVESSSLEIGPAVLMTDGRAFFVGATGATALYTPSAVAGSAGTWAPGPTLPPSGRLQRGSKDGPAVLMPSGNVLFPAAPVDGVRGNYNSPSTFYEFDGTTITAAGDPPNANCPTYVGRMLMLGSGQCLWIREDDSALHVWTETGQPRSSFRPVITSAPGSAFPGTTITVAGTQFNGLSQAVGYGDDYAAATNYPLARLTHRASGRVRYARTSDHTVRVGRTTRTSMGVATGSATITTQVHLPGDLDLGQHDLRIVANGIASDPVAVLLVPEGDPGKGTDRGFGRAGRAVPAVPAPAPAPAAATIRSTDPEALGRPGGVR